MPAATGGEPCTETNVDIVPRRANVLRHFSSTNCEQKTRIGVATASGRDSDCENEKRPQTSRSAGVFVVRTPLSVDLVQQARQAVSAAQELFLDDGRVFENVVVLDLRALGARSIDFLADFVRLLRPVGGLSGRDPGFFLVGQPVDLLLPLGVAPVCEPLRAGSCPRPNAGWFRG